MTLWSFSTGSSLPVCYSVLANALSISESDTSGGNVSETKGTKGSAQTDGTAYEFAVGDLITIGLKAPAASTTARSKTVEEVKVYRVASTTSATHTSALEYNGANVEDAFQWLGGTEQILLRAWSRGSSATPTDPATYVAATPFVLTTNQSSGYDEVLYSPQATYTNDHGAAQNVPLYHQLSRVVITLTEEIGSVSAKTVTLGDGVMALPKTASFADPASGHYGTWTALNASEKEIITPLVEAANQTYSAVLLPGTYAAGGKFINITIGSDAFSYVISAGGLTLSAGCQYNFDITVKNKQITFTVSVTPWSGRNQTVNFPVS